MRRDLAYYRVALDYLRRYAPDGKTLIDAGAGWQWGCRYLERLRGWSCTLVELPSKQTRAVPPTWRLILQDLHDWTPDRQFDAALSLQCFEHLRDPASVAQKLFSCARVVIISVPYKWAKGAERTHVHDPVDERKLQSWTGRVPTESTVVNRRLVAAYA
jgi:hypothetical protein